MKKNKIGRNDPCPCGSGIKYKKCCIDIKPPSPEDIIDLKNSAQNALDAQRKQQQGLGKSIISTLHQGYRVVAVGNTIHYSKNWNTFHDFLESYIVTVFSKKWFEAESKKSKDMHIIIEWGLCLKRLKTEFSSGAKINSAEMTGPVHRFLTLSYNLYLLAHNAELQRVLVKRLKNPQQFEGAFFETVVAGVFAKAGFEIKLEDENDSDTTHCEFIATHSTTKERCGVEVKNRTLNKQSVSIGNQLYKALKKQAPDKRFIFINLNRDHQKTEKNPFYWDKDVIDEIQNKENITVRRNEPPCAYVFVMNYPISNDNKASMMPAIHTGYRIPELKWQQMYDFRHLVDIRERHIEYFDLIKSIKSHGSIPSTFDGSLPELTFENEEQFFVIGKMMTIETPEGDVTGILKMATVMSSEKKVWCVLILPTGKETILTVPMTDKELNAYHRNPQHFIVQENNNKKIEKGDYLTFYDWIYSTYKNTDKNRLIELLNMDKEEAKKYSQKKLAKEFSIRNTYSIIANDPKRKKKEYPLRRPDFDGLESCR